MSQVFLSYKREDLSIARQLRHALRAEGYRVWWDEDLQGGSRWAPAIDEALLRSSVVVVLWSPGAVNSDWVKHEASIANSRGVLVPVIVAECVLPEAFASVQAVKLTGWTGGEKESSFRSLVTAVRRIRRRAQIRTALRALWVVLVLLTGIVIGYFANHGRMDAVVSAPDADATGIATSSHGDLASLLTDPAICKDMVPSQGGGRELEIAQQIETLVENAEYSAAAALFDSLVNSRRSGVGYGAFPKAAYAFDQIGNPNGALCVLKLLNEGLNSSGYLSPGRPPRQFLRDDFENLLPNVDNLTVKRIMAEIQSRL